MAKRHRIEGNLTFTDHCEESGGDKWKRLAIFLVVWSILLSCNSLSSLPTPTPLPGWRNSIGELFVATSSFPSGWHIEPLENAIIDVTVNNASSTYFDASPKQSGRVIETIWRAYTTAEAEKTFNEREQSLASRGWLSRFPSTGYGPIAEVAFQSKVADEWSVSCGIDGSTDCRYLALYHNYVTAVYFPLQFEGFHGLDSKSAEELLSGVEGKFKDYLQLQETAPLKPPVSSLAPTPSPITGTGINIERFFIQTEAMPKGWAIAFRDWTDVTNLASGVILGSRNYYRDECYVNSSYFSRCYITQFVAWYPSTRSAIEEWQNKYSEISVGEPAKLGVWRIPDDITLVDAGADQSFVACSEVAGGEDCEAVLRFGNYWIALMAEMDSQTTLMGHSRFGLTHLEFAQLVEKVASQAESILKGVK